MTKHNSFITVTMGPDQQSPPMKLFEKAITFGFCNPSEIDFTEDRLKWGFFWEEVMPEKYPHME
jgi:hypothetical protein